MADKTVGKSELIDELSAKLGKSKVECYSIYNSLLEIIDEHLKKQEAVRLDIGTIEVVKSMKKFYAREKGSLLTPGKPATGRVIEGMMVRVKFKTSRYKRYFNDPASIKPIGGRTKEEPENPSKTSTGDVN
jgi:hypothetical protein